MLRLFALACGLLAAALPAAADTFTVGVVPQFERRQLYAVWKPILAELEKRTGHRFEMATSTDIADFDRQYFHGAFDFAYMNPYLAVVNPQGYLPLVRDKTPLYGILVVRKDSPVTTPRELDGAEIAFPTPNAIGASMLIRAELAKKFQVRFTPRYVKSHTAVYLSVAQGLTAAGGGVQKTFDEQKEAVRDALRIVHRTAPFASHPIAAHPRVAPAVREQVRVALLALAASAEGTALLGEVPLGQMVATSAKDYEPLRDLGLQEFFVPERP